MGRHILVLYVLLSVLCVHISTGGRLAHGQHIDLSNFSPVAVGYGGRALAMGGSCLAFVDDATAISCNPSGLTKVYNSQALFCGRFTFGSHQPHLSETAIDGAVLETARASRFVPELVALVFPLQQLNQNIVGGLAVREVFDLSHETLYKYGNLDDVDGQHRQIEKKENGTLFSLSAALGAEIATNISMGVSFNFLSGRDENRYTANSATNGESFVDSMYVFENKYSGFSLDLGLTAAVAHNLSLGCVVSTPYTLHLVNIRETRDQSLSKLDDLRLKLPMFMSIGAAYRPLSQLLLSADMRWLSWSRVSVDSTSYSITLPFEDVNTFHLGLEYLFSFDDMVIPLRAGFHTDPKITREFSAEEVADASVSADAQIRGNAFSLGTGLHFSNVAIELSAQYSFSKYKAQNVFEPDGEAWAVDERITNVLLSVLVKI